MTFSVIRLSMRLFNDVIGDIHSFIGIREAVDGRALMSR
jgi:hypothetical protein